MLGIDTQRVLSSRHRRRERQLIRAAIERAYRAFGRSNPRWTASFFDEYFITQTVVRWLGAPRSAGSITASRLAAAWAMQLTTQPVRSAELRAECLPVAAEFLRLLREELPPTLTIPPTPIHSHADAGPLGEPNVLAL